MNRPIRVVIAKAGLDGHQAGVRIVAQALRGAGMEVIYLGLYHTVEQIVATALQENADVIGLSSLGGAHREVVPRVARAMREHHLDDVLLVVGGVIPNVDLPALKEAGVDAVFKTGTPLPQIVRHLETAVAARRAERSSA
jgi:methylmalonyl-CoA mutase C-terminal domain/subunit